MGVGSRILGGNQYFFLENYNEKRWDKSKLGASVSAERRTMKGTWW